LQLRGGRRAGAAPLALGVLPAAPPPASSIRRDGTALYLRADIDLVGTTLQAGGSAAHTSGIVGALRRRGHDVLLAMTGGVAGTPPDVHEERLPAWRAPNVPVELAELVSGLLQAARPRAPDDPPLV